MKGLSVFCVLCFIRFMIPSMDLGVQLDTVKKEIRNYVRCGATNTQMDVLFE